MAATNNNSFQTGVEKNKMKILKVHVKTSLSLNLDTITKNTNKLLKNHNTDLVFGNVDFPHTLQK